MEVELKGPAFVWAVGLVIVRVSKWRVWYSFGVGGARTHGSFDYALPVADVGFIICNIEPLNGAYERQASEYAWI